jgi:hypothetical protein
VVEEDDEFEPVEEEMTAEAGEKARLFAAAEKVNGNGGQNGYYPKPKAGNDQDSDFCHGEFGKKPKRWGGVVGTESLVTAALVAAMAFAFMGLIYFLPQAARHCHTGRRFPTPYNNTPLCEW